MSNLEDKKMLGATILASSLGLFFGWIPFIGAPIAGFVGGKVAKEWPKALVVALIAGFVSGIPLVLAGMFYRTLLGMIPVFGSLLSNLAFNIIGLTLVAFAILNTALMVIFAMIGASVSK
jgi:hypothetical protein